MPSSNCSINPVINKNRRCWYLSKINSNAGLRKKLRKPTRELLRRHPHYIRKFPRQKRISLIGCSFSGSDRSARCREFYLLSLNSSHQRQIASEVSLSPHPKLSQNEYATGKKKRRSFERRFIHLRPVTLFICHISHHHHQIHNPMTFLIHLIIFCHPGSRETRHVTFPCISINSSQSLQ